MSELEEIKQIVKSPRKKNSPTSINTYRTCPRQYYYNYILKLPILPSIHLVKGNVVHKTLELFFNEYNENLEENIFNILETEWTKSKDKLDELKLSPEQLEKEKQDVINMITMFFRTFRIKMDGLIFSEKAEGERHAFYLLKPKFREKFYDDEELNLCGFVDRIHKDWDGTVTLGDYKTSNRMGIGNKIEYEVQCALYALLHYRKTGELPDYTSIIYIRFGEEVKTIVTPEQIKWVMTILEDVSKRTESTKEEDYPKCEGKLCKWCSFFEKCSGMMDKKEQKITEEIMKKIKEKKK